MTDSHSPASKKTIMVVDDTKEIVTLLKLILETEGYLVQSAYRGKEVFKLLEEQKPDLIILDVMMPQMDGLEVLTRLKENPDTASIPVILLTVKTQHEDILTGYKKGADYYLTKPLTAPQLLTGINSLLSRGQGDSVERP